MSETAVVLYCIFGCQLGGGGRGVCVEEAPMRLDPINRVGSRRFSYQDFDDNNTHRQG